MNAAAPPAGQTRRQVLKVVAAVAALPLGALALRHLAGRPAPQTWTGESLGGPARLTLWHTDAAFARRTILRMRVEIERLERVFSLLRHDSEVARLNRTGRLAGGSADLVAVVEEALRASALSGGAFDPTVQPLWRLYESHYRVHPDDRAGPPAAAIDAARAKVGYRNLAVDGRRVALAGDGMAVTLNGIAQGYITDRIADLLREEGFDQAMVELGETRALGQSPEGGPWSIGLKNPRDPLTVNRTVAVANEAVAVSGGYGMRFGRSTSHHIFDPATGRSADRLLDVTVVAPRATTADALATAIFVAGEAAAPRLLAAYRGARAMFTPA